MSTEQPTSEASYLCGVDIGGTFTDCVVLSPDGEILVGKASTTPRAFEEGIVNAIADAAEDAARPDLVARIGRLVHATTIGTNAVVERRGADVGLLTTRGHADTMHFMRGNGAVVGLGPEDLLWISRSDKPDPLVPKPRTGEVVERIDRDGEVVTPLDEGSVVAALDELVERGAEALAICLLWSFRNPEHEQRVRDIVAERHPGLFVTASADLLPRWGEYERTVATVVNCYIGPVMRDYLRRLSARLSDAGLRGQPMMFRSAGGTMGLETAMAKPLFTLGSGPAAGIEASARLARRLGFSHVVATDMGGTTFDVGLVVDGAPVIADTGEIAQYEYKSPHIETRSIGAGGGSLIWFDERSGSLKVGPGSAGADPGPACYDQGGEQPTITDANLVLGRLEGSFFLGGKRSLSVERALEALERVGARLGWDARRTASAALEIAEFQMAELIRRMTVQNGIDPRHLTVFAYGGAGPLHAVVLARELGAGNVVIPQSGLSSVWSAFGAAVAGPATSAYRDEIHPLPVDPTVLRAQFAELREEADRTLTEDGVSADRREARFAVSTKYAFQVHEITLEVGDLLDGPAFNDRLLERMKAEYERVFGAGTSYADAGAEIVRLEVTVTQPSAHEFPSAERPPERPAEAWGERPVYWRHAEDFVPTPVVRAEGVVPGAVVRGPAIVELSHTTVAVDGGAVLRVDAERNMLIDVSDDEGSLR